MIINKYGLTIRLDVDSVSVAGRATQGGRLLTIKDGDSIAAVCRVNKSEDKPNSEEETSEE